MININLNQEQIQNVCDKQKALKKDVSDKKNSLQNPSSNPVCLNKSASNISGQYLTFCGASSTANSLTQDFLKTSYLSASTKIPDGFKFFSNVKSFQNFDKLADLGEQIIDDVEKQITIVDRKKDRALTVIFADYKKQVPVWKKSFERNKKEGADWESELIEKTIDFVKKYSRDELSDQDRQKIFNTEFKEPESYLGKIISKGVAVCRHRSFLMKILLENQGIDLGVQYGHYFNDTKPILKSIGGHAWNVREIEKNGIKTQEIIDASQSVGSKEKYLDVFFNRLYESEKPDELADQIKKLKPGDHITIGIDENNQFTTNLSNKKLKPLLELNWTKKDEINLSNVNTEEKVIIKSAKGLIGENTPLEGQIFCKLLPSNAYFKFDPLQIRQNFNLELSKAKLKIGNDKNNQISLAEAVNKANQEISVNSIKTFLSPDFRQGWKKHS